MKKFEILDTNIKGLLRIKPIVFDDQRGYYIKSYEKNIFREIGLDLSVQEICGSMSHKGVLRGLHFQYKNAQSKLVRCAYGRIYDVAVDLRKNSSTFGKWYGLELSSENNEMLFIPSGFAHGILALTEPAILSYHSAEIYEPIYDSGIRWDDKDLNINWPLKDIDNVVTLSEKDNNLMSFNEFKRQFGSL